MTIYNVVRNNLRPQFMPSSTDIGILEEVPDTVYQAIATQCWSTEQHERPSLCTVIEVLSSISE